jgi:zinc protease
MERFMKQILKNNFRYFLFFSILLISILSCSYNKSLKNPSNSNALWIYEQTDIKPDPDVIFGTLKNNLRYVLLKNREPKDVVAMHLNIFAGSLNEKDGEEGIAHFLEHMLFNGTENFPPGKLVEYFEKIGMSFGPDANAHTGFKSTIYDIILPDGKDKNIAEALIVFKDYIEGALLLEEEIEKEKGIILSEKNTSDSVHYRTFIETLKFEFPDSIISKRLPIGKEEVIKKADNKLLKYFYDTWYRPENLVLVIVGDFNIDAVRKEIEKRFSSILPRAPASKQENFGKIDHKGIKAFYHYEKEAGSATVKIENIKESYYEIDSSKLRKNKLINLAGDMIVQKRLNKMLDQGDAPFTHASIISGKFLKYVEYASISAGCNPEKWEETLFTLEQTLRNALINGFNYSEIDLIKKELLSQLDSEVKERPTKNSRSLAFEILHALNNDEVFTSALQEKTFYEPLIKNITNDDLYKAFKNKWGETRLILVTGNAKLAKRDDAYEKNILEAYKKSSAIEVVKPTQENLFIFPYIEKPKKTCRIIKKSEIEHTEIIQIDFENGVRLNLKKTDFSANDIIFSLNFGYGSSNEPENLAGLSILAPYVINKSGTKTLTNYEIEKLLADKNTNITFKVRKNCFNFSGKTTPDEIELSFQLLQSYILDMGFRQEAYNLAMDHFKQAYASMKSSISGAMPLYGEKFIAGGDSRFGYPEYKKFEKLKLDDIKNWIEPSLKNDYIEISFVGKFDIDTVIKNASIYLGTLSKREKRKKVNLIKGPIFPKGSFKEYKVETKIPKSIVLSAYPTDDFLNIKQTRRLNILSRILSNRMREQIREKNSESYAVYAFNVSSLTYKDYGMIKAFAHVKQGVETRVLDEIKKIAENIAANGITEDELVRAKAPTLAHIKKMQRKNDYWLDNVMSLSIDMPQKFEWCLDIYEDYNSITAIDIEKLAEKYLKSSEMAAIIASPN